MESSINVNNLKEREATPQLRVRCNLPRRANHDRRHSERRILSGYERHLPGEHASLWRRHIRDRAIPQRWRNHQRCLLPEYERYLLGITDGGGSL